MGAPEKERRLTVGLGQPGSEDLSAGKPSKAPGNQEQNLLPSSGSRAQRQDAAWRPSQAAQERLRSLAPVRGRRRLAMPRGLRVAVSFALLLGGLYLTLRLWKTPTASDFHPALMIFAVLMILLFLAAVVSASLRRRQKRGDEKSTLRLRETVDR